MLPPIRYPLPTLVLLLVLGLVAWRGERMLRPLRTAMAARLARAVEGPPVPSSSTPQVVAGPIVRKALLLHDDVEVSSRPDAPASDRIRFRMFVDVYDIWPLNGEPQWFRVGNRRPVGWVKRSELLPWNTRLVVRPTASAGAAGNQGEPKPLTIGSSLPVVSWASGSIEAVAWEADRAWQAVGGSVTLREADLRPGDWGVWISRDELLNLLRSLAPGAREPAQIVRLRAILGRLSDDRPLSRDDLSTAEHALPAPALTIKAASAEAASEALARVNEAWTAEAAWNSLSFQFLPLSDLP